MDEPDWLPNFNHIPHVKTAFISSLNERSYLEKKKNKKQLSVESMPVMEF